MSNEYNEYIACPILPEESDIKFTDLYDRTLPVVGIDINDGIIENLMLSKPIEGKDVYHKGEFQIIKEMLEIPGIGKVSPGTIIEYENNTYVLLFGWHTNYSNQTIYSWYIIRDNVCHTLYKEMINKINTVKVM